MTSAATWWNAGQAIMLTKSKEWSYEAEWRLTCAKGGQPVRWPCELTGVMFGLRMKPDYRRLIHKFTRKGSVRFSTMELSKTAFRLEQQAWIP